MFPIAGDSARSLFREVSVGFSQIPQFAVEFASL
jgi:hypothetical protein